MGELHHRQIEQQRRLAAGRIEQTQIVEIGSRGIEGRVGQFDLDDAGGGDGEFLPVPPLGRHKGGEAGDCRE